MAQQKEKKSNPKKHWSIVFIGWVFLAIGVIYNLMSVVSNLYFVSVNLATAQITARVLVTLFFVAFGLTQVLAPCGIKFASNLWKCVLFCMLPACFLVSVWSNLGNIDVINNNITSTVVLNNTEYKDAQDAVVDIQELVDSIKKNLTNYQKIIDDKNSTKDEINKAIDNKSYVDRTQYKPALSNLKEAKKVRREAKEKAESEAENSADENVFLKYLNKYKKFIAVFFEVISFVFVSVGLNILLSDKNQAEIRGNKKEIAPYFCFGKFFGNAQGNVSHVSAQSESASMGNRETSTKKMGNVQNMTRTQYGKLNDSELANILKDLNMINKSQKEIRRFLRIRTERVTNIIKIAKANQNKIRLAAMNE